MGTTSQRYEPRTLLPDHLPRVPIKNIKLRRHSKDIHEENWNAFHAQYNSGHRSPIKAIADTLVSFKSISLPTKQSWFSRRQGNLRLSDVTRRHLCHECGL